MSFCLTLTEHIKYAAQIEDHSFILDSQVLTKDKPNLLIKKIQVTNSASPLFETDTSLNTKETRESCLLITAR